MSHVAASVDAKTEAIMAMDTDTDTDTDTDMETKMETKMETNTGTNANALESFVVRIMYVLLLHKGLFGMHPQVDDLLRMSTLLQESGPDGRHRICRNLYQTRMKHPSSIMRPVLLPATCADATEHAYQHMVRSLYNGILNRAPDHTGMVVTMNALRSGPDTAAIRIHDMISDAIARHNGEQPAIDELYVMSTVLHL